MAGGFDKYSESSPGSLGTAVTSGSFAGVKSQARDPNATDFTAADQWCFFHNTLADYWYVVYYDGSAVTSVMMSEL